MALAGDKEVTSSEDEFSNDSLQMDEANNTDNTTGSDDKKVESIDFPSIIEDVDNFDIKDDDIGEIGLVDFKK